MPAAPESEEQQAERESEERRGRHEVGLAEHAA
jgi:hypothetical protein